MTSPGIASLKSIRYQNRCLLLGVTGGIASGKTTVARMLEELGAKLIDFDVLSRTVVEPEKPAWRDVTAYFGEQVLLRDKTLDRKKLGKIVFGDEAKRKILENFIHPRIYEEFHRLVREISSSEPGTIIQGVVPLLFEANLQPLFHKILLVYIPRELQVERLMKRDGISRKMAYQILDAQLPIEDKRKQADYIVDNSGALSQTKRQVGEIWGKLQKLTAEREPQTTVS
jgi:dephospho-CoA kinase